MPKPLDVAIQSQIEQKLLKPIYSLTIAGNDCSDFLLDFNVSFDKQFGSASASFTLFNGDGQFGDGSSNGVFVGDKVEFKQKYHGSDTWWHTFYGFVDSRAISKSGDNRVIVFTCLDYLSQLKNWDINLKIEAPKYEVTNEILEPNYLPEPNQMFAQVFNFANGNIAQLPPPILTVKLKNTKTDDGEDETGFNGFDFSYDSGQVKLSSPFNVLDNYDVVAKSYFHYPIGLYVEDILKIIFTSPNAYGKYLFDEASAQEVIDNHLTSSFLKEEGVVGDELIPNVGSTKITIRHKLAQAYKSDESGYDATKLYLESVEGLPESGEGNINGDIFSWTAIEDGNVLVGIPEAGPYSLSNHDETSIMKYTQTYQTGQVWYLKYSNIISNLKEEDFTLQGSNILYMDKRYGRIILSSPRDWTLPVFCNVNYQFYSLQASGIELNYISLASRQMDNAFAAVEEVLKYVAPNYLVRTQGDELIWSSYVSQKTKSDYSVELIQSLEYMEDIDLYTHTVFYGRNKNPQNILYDQSTTFVTTGLSYKSETTQTELLYDSSFDGWHKFITHVGDAGSILADEYVPIIYINGVPVDNKIHQQIRKPVTIINTNKSVTTVKKKKFLGIF